MTRDDWAELKHLFHAALELSGTDRGTYLDRAGRERPDLAEQLRAMVAAHAGAPDFLEEPATRLASFGDALGALEPDDVLSGALVPGHVLDQTYEIDARLGSGGMGVVYRVRHRALARMFAAKLIHAHVADDPAFLERFTREAEALGKLRHPHIVDVTDFGIDRQGTAHPYLVMEYLEGPTLQEQLLAGPLAPDVALPMFQAIASALDHAHHHGVLHLDLKPGNILLVGGPDGLPSPKILDFGLAQFVATELDQPAQQATVGPIGTPAYMAPELLSGLRPGAAADIHALGVLMFEVLVGRCPYTGTTAQVLDQIRHEAPSRPSSLNDAIPPDVDAALTAALAKQPTARPVTAAAAVALLRDALLAARQRRWRQAEVPRRLAAAAAIAVGLSLAFPLWQSSPIRVWERKTVDWRFALAVERPPAPDILLLVLDDASLAADATPLVQRADKFGADLDGVFRAGARAVALDFLLPESWSRSAAFSQLALRHADRITLAAFSSASGVVIGPEAIAGVTTVALGPERAAALFGFVNLDQADDGVSRRARLWYRDREGTARPSFPARAAATAGVDPAAIDGAAERADEFWIDHTVDGARFERVSWKDLEATLRTRPELFRDRLVIAGADFAGSGDEGRVPNRGVVPGVVIHALATETILSRFPVREVKPGMVAGAAGVACGLLCAAILLGRGAKAGVVSGLLLAGAYVVGAVVLFRLTKVLVPAVAPVLVSAIGVAAASGIRRSRPAFPER